MRAIHTSSSPVMQLGVDTHQYFDAVAGPRGYLGRGDAGVQPPGDTGMAQIVGAGKQRGGQLAAVRRTAPRLLPYPRLSRRGERVAALAAEQAPVAPGAVPGEVLAEDATSSGGMGTWRDGRRARLPVAGRPLVRPFSPRSSCTRPSSVKARPAAGVESAKARHPQPSRAGGSRQGQRGDLRRAHHRVVHARVERREPRSLPPPDIVARGEHSGDQRGGADAPRVDHGVWCLRWRPALG